MLSTLRVTSAHPILHHADVLRQADFQRNLLESLGKTITTVRRRLKMTMTEFASLIGSDNSTISRYEAGRIIPSKPVLILLLLLAHAEERKPFMEALGVGEETPISPAFSDPMAILTLQGLSTPKSRGGHRDPGLADFAREIAAMAKAGQRIHPALIRAVQLLRAHDLSDREMREHFTRFVHYLEISLVGRKTRKT